jgi:hypothetical protein
MPYVVRDKNGCVVSVIANPGSIEQGRLKSGDSEIQDFFDKQQATRQLQEVLVASDMSFVRVLEDLIGVLLDKGILMLTDLPDAAQEKILERKGIRDHIANLSELIDDPSEDDIML